MFQFLRARTSNRPPLPPAASQPTRVDMSSDLQQELRDLIAPWRKKGKKPPADIEQLVVIALALNDKLTGRQVHDWILRTFEHYNRKAREAMAALGSTHLSWHPPNGPYRAAQRVTDAINDVFTQYEVPIQCIEVPEDSALSDLTVRNFESTWQVSLSAARIFLQPLLPTPKVQEEEKQAEGSVVLKAKKHFPFLSLPVELRLLIYELVLRYPKSGLSIRRYMSNDMKGHTLTREPDVDVDENALKCFYSGCRDCASGWRHRTIFHARSLASSLTLLQVSRLVYKEAMPVFYGDNHFANPDLEFLIKLPKQLSIDRIKEFKHISFAYRPSHAELGAKAFKVLQSMTQLRELDIWIWEDEWSELESKKGGSKVARYPDMLRLPGINTLRGLIGLKAVRFHGDCENIKQIAEGMVKAEEPKKTPSRKRKTKVLGEEGSTTRSKKAKKVPVQTGS